MPQHLPADSAIDLRLDGAALDRATRALRSFVGLLVPRRAERARTKPTEPPAEPGYRYITAGRNTPAARAYVNDRRAGRTHPGELTLIEDGDPRYVLPVNRYRGIEPQQMSRRAYRRTYGGERRLTWAAQQMRPLSHRLTFDEVSREAVDRIVSAVDREARLATERAKADRNTAQALR